MAAVNAFMQWCLRHRAPIVWVLRLIVGGTFIFSGFTKAVDIWGFIYKLDDYMAAWSIDWVPEEALRVFAAIIIIAEFSSGLLLALGCLRRFSALVVMGLMCFMLPLTAYIYIANPVEDCGCFGDAWIISNGATFAKNIFLTAMAAVLLVWNTKVRGLYPPVLEWVVAMAAVVFCILVIAIGYFAQPMIDFRPYPVGSSLLSNADESVRLVYEKEGRRQAFSVDSLPDDSWTYVGREQASKPASDGKHLAIFDGDEDVTRYVIEESGPQIILSVSNPSSHKRARASMANKVNEYAERIGGNMIGIVATHPDSLENWKEYSNPDFDVYTAEDTSLKELARGDAALIYLEDGIIKWKRNIYWLPGDFPDFDTDGNAFEQVRVYGDGTIAWRITLIFVALLIILWAGSMPATLKRRKK